jgi:putative transposase
MEKGCSRLTVTAVANGLTNPGIRHSLASRPPYKATGCTLAFENLKGMRGRATVRRQQRARHAGWAFGQLRSFVEYKAKLGGVPVVFVDPRNTSRTCPECGHCEKANRKSQADFECRQCYYSANADFVGARNVRSRAMCQVA